MKVQGDIESVNLATGERLRRVSGEGESRLEPIDIVKRALPKSVVEEIDEKHRALEVPPRRNRLHRREGPITHERAKDAALRLIHSHFGQEPHARICIPCDLDDDDVVIMDYIEQQIQKDLGLQ